MAKKEVKKEEKEKDDLSKFGAPKIEITGAMKEEMIMLYKNPYNLGCSRIADIISKKFKKSISDTTVWRRLNDWGIEMRPPPRKEDKYTELGSDQGL